jgi:hypothetical protein
VIDLEVLFESSTEIIVKPKLANLYKWARYRARSRDGAIHADQWMPGRGWATVVSPAQDYSLDTRQQMLEAVLLVIRIME